MKIKKMTTKKMTCKLPWVIFNVIILCFIISSNANAQQTNFSGKWLINIEKSTLGDVPIQAVRELNIDQKPDSILIKRIGVAKQTDSISTMETLAFDGTQIEYSVTDDTKKKAYVSWSDDKNALTETSEVSILRGGKDFEYNINQVFTLSGNGKILTAKSVVTVTSDEQSVKYGIIAVYDKQ